MKVYALIEYNYSADPPCVSVYRTLEKAQQVMQARLEYLNDDGRGHIEFSEEDGEYINPYGEGTFFYIEEHLI